MVGSFEVKFFDESFHPRIQVSYQKWPEIDKITSWLIVGVLTNYTVWMIYKGVIVTGGGYLVER